MSRWALVSHSSFFKFHRIVFLCACAALLNFTVAIEGCGGGGSTTTPPVQPPTNLQYAQPTITAVQGTAITADTATVTGTVTGYAASPALPGGLSLNSSTGAISGTPTTVTAGTAYTVTASNSAGSTTASVTISVALAAPSNLVYPQKTIAATVGTAITTDTPTVSGSVSSFSISPALPAGLNFDTTTGAISGTPFSGSAQTAYIVTATNSAGSTTAQVTITVTQGSSVLLELGHGTSLVGLSTAGDRVLSEDATGHWNLWDYTSSKIITSGNGALTPVSPSNTYLGDINLAGQTAAVETSSGINVFSANDGSALAIIPSATWWKLASDGSYICTGSTTALTVYSTSGQTLATHNGDYHAAVAFAAPGQVQIARGPAGANVVETLTVPSGTDTVSVAFNGTFSSWFLDGAHFLTTVGNTVYTYTSAGVQQGISALPTVSNLTGQGNWIWVTGILDLQVYAIGSSTPALDTNFDSTYLASALLIAIPQPDTPGISIVDLSGSSPVATSYSVSAVSIGSIFASASSSQWLIDSGSGAIIDGATISGTVRTLGYGQIQSIAATANLVALAASNGQILLMDPVGKTVQSTINVQASRLKISSDGSVLGVLEGTSQKVNFYSLPSSSVISSFAYVPPVASTQEVLGITSWALSSLGSTIAIPTSSSSLQIMGITGTPVIWSGTPEDPICLSPDGTLAAIIGGPWGDGLGQSSAEPSTNIYQNGTLISAIQANPSGWIDNGHLLAQTFGPLGPHSTSAYAGSNIYSPSGAVLSSFAANSIPGMQNPQFLAGNLVLNPATPPAIYSLNDGSLVWAAPQGAGSNNEAAVSGSNVVVQVGHQVLLYPF